MVDDQYPDYRRYRFGSAVFDEASRVLQVDGTTVKTTAQQFNILQVLLRHCDQLVDRDRLRRMVWKRPEVSDDAINTAISRVNDCLGPANAGRIVTLSGLGYRLTGPVAWEIIGIRVDSNPVMRVKHPPTVDDTPVGSLLKFISDNLINPANPAMTGRTRSEVVALVRDAAAQIDATIDAGRPEIRAVLHREMQGLFSQLGEFEQAITHGRDALEAATRRDAPDPAQIGDIQLTLARDLIQQSRLEEALALIEATERLIAPTAMRHAALQVRILLRRGQHAIGALAVREAVGFLDQAAALETTLAARDPDLTEQIAFELAQACWLADDYAHAEPVARRLMNGQIERYGSDSAWAAYSAVLLANILAFADRCDEAIALLEPAIETLSETLGPDDRKTVTGRGVLANIAFKEGQYAKAAEMWRALKEHFTRITGARSINALVNDQNIALALKRCRKKTEAEQILRETLGPAREVFGEDGPSPQLLKYELADILLDDRKTDEAVPLLAGLDPARLKEAKIQDDWPAVLIYQEGRIAWHRGDRPRALHLLEQAADMLAQCKNRGPISEADIRDVIARIRQETDSEV